MRQEYIATNKDQADQIHRYIVKAREKRREEIQAKKVRKIFSVILAVILALSVALAILAWRDGVFRSEESMKAALDRAGLWAPSLFICLQITQCIISIIPGGLTLIVGVVVFGPVKGFILNYIGIILGSSMAFLLAKFFGKSLVKALAPKKSLDRYGQWLNKNQKKFNTFWLLAMFFPFFPDDLLCLLAGLSNMPFSYFFFNLLWTKLPSILAYSLLVDPAKGWFFKWVQGRN